MSAQDELDSAFQEVGSLLKPRVVGLGGLAAIERLTLAEWNSRKTAGTLLPSVLYFTVG